MVFFFSRYRVPPVRVIDVEVMDINPSGGIGRGFWPATSRRRKSGFMVLFFENYFFSEHDRFTPKRKPTYL